MQCQRIVRSEQSRNKLKYHRRITLYIKFILLRLLSATLHCNGKVKTAKQYHEHRRSHRDVSGWCCRSCGCGHSCTRRCWKWKCYIGAVCNNWRTSVWNGTRICDEQTTTLNVFISSKVPSRTACMFSDLQCFIAFIRPTCAPAITESVCLSAQNLFKKLLVRIDVSSFDLVW